MAGLVEPVMSKEEIKVRVVWPNGWWLFAVISAVITTFMMLRLASADQTHHAFQASSLRRLALADNTE